MSAYAAVFIIAKKMETPQMSISGQTAKCNVVNPHNGILVGNQKE